MFVTGATGFLGRSVVSAVTDRGHEVRALVRPAASALPAAWLENPVVDIVRADLRDRSHLTEILAGIDVVVHLAAAKTGDLYEQFGSTVIATENLLDAMSNAKVRRIVLISSFSVYEYLKRRAWSVLDEDAPLAKRPFDRDEYCQTKLIQERITLEWAGSDERRCVVMRPGVIFGPDNLWTARLGAQAGDRRWLRMGSFARLPLTYVENCAEAIVLAAEYRGPDRALVLNIVDDVTPSQRAYMRKLQQTVSPRPRVVVIPWTVMRILARFAFVINRLFFSGTARIPGVFVPCRLHARIKPLRYTNRKIVSTLGWKPRYSWREGVDRSSGAR